MSRKDYRILAAALKKARAHHLELGYPLPRLDAAEFIAEVLQNDNPRFDRTRFFRAVYQ